MLLVYIHVSRADLSVAFKPEGVSRALLRTSMVRGRSYSDIGIMKKAPFLRL